MEPWTIRNILTHRTRPDRGSRTLPKIRRVLFGEAGAEEPEAVEAETDDFLAEKEPFE